jgi:hypothetical protein
MTSTEQHAQLDEFITTWKRHRFISSGCAVANFEICLTNVLLLYADRNLIWLGALCITLNLSCTGLLIWSAVKAHRRVQLFRVFKRDILRYEQAENWNMRECLAEQIHATISRL